ncbi:bifunctional riboflavin kinase/FAD synthetase [Thorsellia kenyensis]|uniref:Riboflavin biosynthesis protein n=1 Tax=Thorsellia kenyensis TaxID=1549888 RepID=A0ABV6CHS3_9GAMM
MQLIRALNNSLNLSQTSFLDNIPDGLALTIGNFDGVHLGHQALISQLKKEANGRKTAVMIFEPQPLEFFSAHNSPPRITHLRDKIKAISKLGIDYLFCFAFNANLAQLTPKEFIDELLIKKLNVSHLLIGDDFRFGAKRAGDIHSLEYLARNRFTVSTLSTISMNGNRISSTALRNALATNDLHAAEKLLGRPFSISGRVIHGDKIGATIGFATANIAMKRVHSPVKGVYAVTVLVPNLHSPPSSITYQGIANIGYRPTVNGKKHLLEVNIFNLNQNLYGQYLVVTLKKKIREETTFVSLDALKNQISQDIIKVEDFFKANHA